MPNPDPSPRTLKFHLIEASLKALREARGSASELANPVDLSMQDAQTLAAHYRNKPYQHGYWNAATVCLEKLNGVRD